MKEERIVFFDGICNLCNSLVQFIIRRDPERKFKFVSLQSRTAESLLRDSHLQESIVSTVLYLRHGVLYRKSDAVIRLLVDVGGIWKFCTALRFFPKFSRDFIYDLVAKSRYGIFGKRKECMVPTPDLADRFL